MSKRLVLFKVRWELRGVAVTGKELVEGEEGPLLGLVPWTSLAGVVIRRQLGRVNASLCNIEEELAPRNDALVGLLMLSEMGVDGTFVYLDNDVDDGADVRCVDLWGLQKVGTCSEDGGEGGADDWFHESGIIGPSG